MPALNRAKKQARASACQVNLHSWGQIWMMYCQDNGGNFMMESQYTGWPRGNWVVALRSLYRTKSGILVCPTAKKRPTVHNSSYGGPFKTYVMGGGGFENRREESSYGHNNWCFNARQGQTKIQQRPVEWNWTTIDMKGGSEIPVFGDSMWRGGGPFYQNGNSGSERIRPPEYHGQWIRARCEMMHFVIDRHNSVTNHLFLDWSIRKVGLKELWTLKWHKKFPQNGFWTMAGGVQPSDWPEWMRKYKDY